MLDRERIYNNYLGESVKKDEPKLGVARRYLKIYLETSSIHGLNHLTRTDRHICEITTWLCLIVSSILGTVYLSNTSWTRYKYSPIVVSMDRNMFAWNTTYPPCTLCPKTKIDSNKLENYVSNSKFEDKSALKDFIVKLANSTYHNFNTVPHFTLIQPDQYMELLINLSTTFDPKILIDAERDISLQATITELGLCYTSNSHVAVYNSPGYRNDDRWDWITNTNELLQLHPLDGEVFARFTTIPTAYDVYIHGPAEVIEASDRAIQGDIGFMLNIYVTASAIYTTEDAGKLSVEQRKCRFSNDPILKHNTPYSYSLCTIECRVKLCLELCNCLPHFYRKLDGENICDVEGLHCLYRNYHALFKPRCDCLPLCNDVQYNIQLMTKEKWFLGTDLHLGIKTYPKMRYKRDVIFGFTDLLVAIGTMAGLFLGCSVLSFIEIIYFLTLKLYWYIHNNK